MLQQQQAQQQLQQQQADTQAGRGPTLAEPGGLWRVECSDDADSSARPIAGDKVRAYVGDSAAHHCCPETPHRTRHAQ